MLAVVPALNQVAVVVHFFGQVAAVVLEFESLMVRDAEVMPFGLYLNQLLSLDGCELVEGALLEFGHLFAFDQDHLAGLMELLQLVSSLN